MTDAARDGCGAEGEPDAEAAEIQKHDLATNIANAILKDCSIPPPEAWDAAVIAIKFLSSRLETAREEMKEECAKVVDAELADIMQHPPDTTRTRGCNAYAAAKARLALEACALIIRSLSVK